MKTLHFEALKAGLSQNKDGLRLSVVVHPNEIPTEVLSAPVGTRWLVTVTEYPETEEQDEEGRAGRAVALAGMLCKQPDFWAFLSTYGLADGDRRIRSEGQCVSQLRDLIGLDSRAELKTNKAARDRLSQINEEYGTWMDRQR